MILGSNALLAPFSASKAKLFWAHLNHLKRAVPTHMEEFDYNRCDQMPPLEPIHTNPSSREETTVDLARPVMPQMEQDGPALVKIEPSKPDAPEDFPESPAN